MTIEEHGIKNPEAHPLSADALPPVYLSLLLFGQLLLQLLQLLGGALQKLVVGVGQLSQLSLHLSALFWR